MSRGEPGGFDHRLARLATKANYVIGFDSGYRVSRHLGARRAFCDALHDAREVDEVAIVERVPDDLL